MQNTETAPAAVQYLRTHPALAYCVDCLSREAGVARATVEQTIEGLKQRPEFEIAPGFCSRCWLHTAVVHQRWASDS